MIIEKKDMCTEATKVIIKGIMMHKKLWFGRAWHMMFGNILRAVLKCIMKSLKKVDQPQ